jgi:hypothetical protein
VLSVALAALAWLPALAGLGAALPSPRDAGLRRGVAGMLGLGLAGTAALLVHLVAPVTPAVSAGLWLGGVLLLVRHRRRLAEGASWAELAGGAFALLLALYWYPSPEVAYDSGLYYQQTVRWLTEHPVRLGLGNLHGRLAFNSLWLAATAALELPGLAGRGWTFVGVLPMVLAGQVAGVGLRRCLRARRTFPDAALALLFPVVGHAVRGLGAAHPDAPAELGVALSLVLWIGALEADAEGFAADARPATLVGLFAVLVKLSSVPVLAAPALAVWLRRREVTGAWLLRTAAPCALAAAAWTAHGFLLSGCAAYPVPATCAPVGWAVPDARVREEGRWIAAWARAPAAPADEVLADSRWLRPWAAAQARHGDVQLFGATLAVGIAVLALSGAGAGGAALWIVLGTAALGALYVLLVAPDPRFAFGALHVLGLAPLAFGLSRLRAPPRRWLAVVALAALAALTLRWARIGHTRRPWRADPVTFPRLPEAPVVERSSGWGVRVRVPVSGDQCWDAPLPCAPSLDADLIEEAGTYAIRRRP